MRRTISINYVVTDQEKADLVELEHATGEGRSELLRRLVRDERARVLGGCAWKSVVPADDPVWLAIGVLEAKVGGAS